jgi:hypothetical protein|tara:strand:+ start:42279 stop:42458 length:180 start_codon:yes stop_codon:yes gene_type:complete
LWTVALLPEPWKASNVGFTAPPDDEPFGGSLLVMYVAFSPDEAMVEATVLRLGRDVWGL